MLCCVFVNIDASVNLSYHRGFRYLLVFGTSLIEPNVASSCMNKLSYALHVWDVIYAHLFFSFSAHFWLFRRLD